MKKKCKMVLSVMLVIGMLISPGTARAYVEETNELSFIEKYWEQISNVLSMKQDNAFFEELEKRGIYYNYQDGRRISKSVNNETIYFIYNNAGQVIEENYNDSTVSYQYNEQGNLAAVSYNDIMYYAETDINGSVINLLNTEGECVAEYTYINGLANIAKESRGGIYDQVIGDINKVRFYSFYYDEETEYYYTSGHFYNIKEGRFVDKLPIDSILDSNCNVSVKRDAISVLGNNVTQWANSLLNNNPNYGEAKPAVSGWYEGLSDVELLARLIYGENPRNMQDQKAVMWIVLNRLYRNWYPNTLRGVATQAGQFATICNTGSYDARKPDIESQAWKNATWLACAICTTTVESECRSLVNKPGGIDTQTCFRALTNFVSRCEDSLNGIVYVYSDGRKSRLTDVVIVGDLGDSKDLEILKNDEELRAKNKCYFDMNSHVTNAKKLSDLTLTGKDFECVGDRLTWNHTKEAYHNVFFNEISLN